MKKKQIKKVVVKEDSSIKVKAIVAGIIAVLGALGAFWGQISTSLGLGEQAPEASVNKTVGDINQEANQTGENNTANNNLSF